MCAGRDVSAPTLSATQTKSSWEAIRMEQHEATAPEQDADEHRGFVIGRLRGGTPKSIVVAELIDRGLERKWAEQIVEQFDIDAAQLAKQEQVTAAAFLLAVIAGALAATIGGALWGLVAGKMGRQFSPLACGVGVLCGFAVVLASGRRKGVPLQVIAAVASIIGIFIGKYCTFYFAFRDMLSEQAGPEAIVSVPLFSGALFQLFLENIRGVLSVFDIVWIPFALIAAWAIPSGAGIKPTRPGDAPPAADQETLRDPPMH